MKSGIEKIEMLSVITFLEYLPVPRNRFNDASRAEPGRAVRPAGASRHLRIYRDVRNLRKSIAAGCAVTLLLPAASQRVRRRIQHSTPIPVDVDNVRTHPDSAFRAMASG
ncbi:hypothetical protein [Nevskia sp.]|uniref:hypothetical protein n=1 Tax=Nevskia sp. TaxID=1929292 RepID=UPI0025FE6354|nr:hypothetical protein [Nevskia sp.]